MNEILKLIWFDCKLERFAEVFGDILEAEDITHLAEVAPSETALKFEALKIFETETADPAELFDLLDTANTSKLSQELGRVGKDSADYETARAFFKFVNDAYLWEDLEDLRRWEEELKDSLTTAEQFRPVSDRFQGEALRSQIFFKYCHHLGGHAFDCVEIVADSLTDSDRLGYYLGVF